MRKNARLSDMKKSIHKCFSKNGVLLIQTKLKQSEMMLSLKFNS